jgi:hypothetical protein
MKKLELEYLIGKNKYDAQKIVENYGYSFRITSENGNHYMITCDFRTDRVNVKIENDIITEVYLG